MKRKLSIGLITAGTLFGVMFLFRLIYGYSSYPAGATTTAGISQSASGFNISRRNIATKKIANYGKGGQVVSTFDQKYEKVASLETRTSELEKDEKQVRDLIKSHNAVIQFEKNRGLKRLRNRRVDFAIGVPPENFDILIVELKKIGTILSLDINKKDKTNEYKDLQAKRTSLTKIRASLIALKGRGGKIEEFIKLENRILEIESEIQKLGINLGEFDSENEFCTVKYTLYEGKKKSGISFAHRVKVALEWTIKYYFILAFAVLFLTTGTIIALIIFEKIRSIIMKMDT